VAQQLSGFFDGMITTPSTYILDYHGIQHPNPTYSTWLRLDQLIHPWSFATISPELLTEVHDLIHSKQIWDSLSHCFDISSHAWTMDLRHTLSNLSKDPKQSVEDYLRHIEYVDDSLASICTLIPNIDLVRLTLNGLDEDCHTLVTILSDGTNLLTFDDFRSKVIHYKQRLKFLKTKDMLSIRHSALSSLVASSESGKSSSSHNRNNWRGSNRNNRPNNTCKGNKNQRAQIVSNNLNLLTRACIQELAMVILFFHGLLFNVHLLLLLICFLQVILHLARS